MCARVTGISFFIIFNPPVGRPIHVKQVANPTEQQVDSLHSLYCDQLRSLYEEYNPKLGNSKVKLVITWSSIIL